MNVIARGGAAVRWRWAAVLAGGFLLLTAALTALIELGIGLAPGWEVKGPLVAGLVLVLGGASVARD